MPTLDFKGKHYVYAHHLSVPFRTLSVDVEKSLSDAPNLDDNLIIHGDNLHGLKALLPQYAGKIKCIYIDPPYNTGNEGWCYNDKVNSPLIREWLKKEANPVDKEDMERHDKWMCMMWPRLQLLRELLADDGVIFISIDDNEVHHLRCLMDEIFGEGNFVAQIAVQLNPRGRTLDPYLAKTHEYVLLYMKDIDSGGLYEIDKDETKITDYRYEDQRGKYRLLELRNRNPVFDRTNRPNLYYPIYSNSDGTSVGLEKSNLNNIEIFPINSTGIDGCWTWGRDKARREKEMLVAKKASTGAWRVFRKDYLHQNGVIATTKEKAIWLDKNINNENGKETLNEMFEKCPFDFPKSHELIKKCLKIGTLENKASLVLDSFAGSGTTAHAVLALNQEDGGNRKFILIECEDYADTITAERVRRVIGGVPTAKDQALKNGLGGHFTYCTLGGEMDIENILSGEHLPDYNALSQYVFYTATGHSLPHTITPRNDFFVGETDIYAVYVIYRDDLGYLRSNQSALNDEKVDIIQVHPSQKKKLVFATAKFMSGEDLKARNITFCQIPYAIHNFVGA